jgi:four helix bundle protein
MKIKDFEDLDVWQRGRDLVIKIYELTNNFPKEEIYGITSQIKRAALSVPANIAEGFGRFHFLDKAKFYLNARGSLYELKSFLLISRDLRFVEDRSFQDILQMINDLSVKLNNFINKTRQLRGD